MDANTSKEPSVCTDPRGHYWEPTGAGDVLGANGGHYLDIHARCARCDTGRTRRVIPPERVSGRLKTLNHLVSLLEMTLDEMRDDLLPDDWQTAGLVSSMTPNIRVLRHAIDRARQERQDRIQQSLERE